MTTLCEPLPLVNDTVLPLEMCKNVLSVYGLSLVPESGLNRSGERSKTQPVDPHSIHFS